MNQNQTSSSAPSTQEKLAEIDRIFSEMGQDSRETSLRPLFYFLKFYWGLQSVSLVVGLIVAFFETLSVGLVLPLLSLLFDPTGLNTTGGRLMTWLNRAIDLIPIEDRVVASCALLISAAVLKFMTSLLGEYLAAYLGGKVIHETKKKLLEKYYRFPYSFFLEHKQAQLKHIILYSTLRLSYSLSLIPLWITELLKIVAIFTLLMFLHLQITFLMIAVGLVFYFFFAYISKKLAYTWGKLFSTRQMEQGCLLDELLTGIKHILVFRVFSHWFTRFDLSSKAQVRYLVEQRLLASTPKSILEVGTVSILFGVMMVLRLFSPNSFLQYVPLIGLLGMALLKLMPSLHMASRTRLELMNLLSDVILVHRVLTSPLPEARYGERIFSTFGNSIAFNDVSFAYPNREPTLQGVNVTFEKNKVTAIVGRSGEGKTTLINLLLGLYEPQQGCIRVDGVDLKQYDIKTWRAHIGFVSQDPFIFHATVAENIAFGDDTYSLEQIVQAAGIANAGKFIEGLPQGYDTLVGERGMKLSGGEQQRIAIARAVLRKPEILIFDEATSALDNVSEKLVQEAISRLSQDHTVLLIAHRLSTVQHADKIVVLHDGRIVGEGTHEELVRRNGVYRRLVRAQILAGAEISAAVPAT